METLPARGTGWQRDNPDPRDYTLLHHHVRTLLVRLRRPAWRDLPEQVDLRSDSDGAYFTPPRDQGPLQSSSAHAALGLVEYFVRRLQGTTFDCSRLFLYRTTRNLLQATGNAATGLRATLKSLVRFGVVPERHWPEGPERLDEEPGAFLYQLAKPQRHLRYFRLDEPNRDGAATLLAVKRMLACGFPVAFGFPLPADVSDNGAIDYRPHDSFQGGQAVVAVGYHDNHPGPHRRVLLVRNSWGACWGQDGYGVLPAIYVEKQLAADFWTLIAPPWCSEGVLCCPPVPSLEDAS